MFDGFQFSEDNPYTYGEAKRLLKLAMGELRKDRRLQRLGLDPAAPGRSAITGTGGTSVWDFLSLEHRPRHGSFTSYPHLTLSIRTDGAEVAVTIPNGVARDVRRRLAELGTGGLTDLNHQILRRSRRILNRGGWVAAYAVQRHFPSQRSAGIEDARLTFNLETSSSKRGRRIQYQPAWTDLVIVDEAHRMSAGSDTKTERYRLGELLRDSSDHLLLLTATPHRGDPVNFSRFLQLLDEDAFADVSSINKAMENRRAPFYLRRTKEAMHYFPERQEDGTWAARKIFTKRIPHTADFAIDGEEYELYRAVTAYVRRQATRAAQMSVLDPHPGR